jgi:nicotinamidase-related amidase
MEYPELVPENTAVLAIDMHRGHLDPSIATMPIRPEQAERVVTATERLFQIARESRVPIIHTILENRIIPGLGREGLRNPYRQAMLASHSELPEHFRGLQNHNIVGDPTTESMPTLKSDYEIRTKRRLGSFYGTDLEILLRALGTESLLIAGINTNTCVLNAAFEAFNRDMTVVLVEECVDSMYGADLHAFALENVRRCLGWVVALDDVPALFQPTEDLVARHVRKRSSTRSIV